MTINGGQPLDLIYVYGWKGRQMIDGPYYIGGASSAGEAIDKARAWHLDRSQPWTRTTAKNIRTGALVYDSTAPYEGPSPRTITRPEGT